MLTYERFFFLMSCQFLRASFDFIFFLCSYLLIHVIIYSNDLFIMHSLDIALTKPYIVAISKNSYHSICIVFNHLDLLK